MSNIQVTRSDGVTLFYSHNWPKKLIIKAANKILLPISNNELNKIERKIWKKVLSYQKECLTHDEFISCIQEGLKDYPDIFNSYKSSRREDIIKFYNEICDQMNTIITSGDKSSGTTDSNLVSSQRALIIDSIEKNIYKNFLLSEDEKEAFNDGYIYIHDMGYRRYTINCCLFDMENVLLNGFEMGNTWYNEPNSLLEAFDDIALISLNTAAQMYGGFTISQIDNILSYYAKKSYEQYYKKYIDLGIDNEKSKEVALSDVRNDFLYGFSSLEYKFNTVISARGDYPFFTITMGICKDEFAEMATKAAISVREKGHGKSGFEKPVLFPKLVFLFDKELHGSGKKLEYLFDIAIECSKKVMYPEFLSMSGQGYIASMYKEYNKVISPMCCRAFLSPWYKTGGMEKANEFDEPVFIGRFNIGVVSLNLPMILMKAKEENIPFFEVLDVYLEIIRNIHKKTYLFLSRKKASSNPMCFMQGGLYGGNLKGNESIGPVLKSATMSYGFTALNELQRLYNGKSLVEDGDFALETIKYINEKVAQYQKEDNLLYTVYGTPAESLCGKQVESFRKKYGIIPNVSDRDYVSNSFHCHVSEDITPIQKQDLESRFWEYANGGKIQYIRFEYPSNTKALKSLVLHAMDLGLYEGINMILSYCNNCGFNCHLVDRCPRCNSTNITKIERMCGFLSYTKINGDTRLNNAKMAEIKDRVSM